MINILSSNADSPSDLFKKANREDGQDNLVWLANNMPAEKNLTILALVGGVSPVALRLRFAQSHLRHDLEPSSWSHVFMIGRRAKNLASSALYEISLEPQAGFGFPPPKNAVQEGKLGHYRDPLSFPNIAVLGIPVEQKEVMKALKRFQMQRAVLDALELLMHWLAYGWGVGRSDNPLLEGRGIPSAAMLEVVFGASGYDLTPGLESRSSCPEAIWQAAKWWHEYYKSENRTGAVGAFHVPHRLQGPEETAKAQKPASPVKKSK
jgi:hypothetical protein